MIRIDQMSYLEYLKIKMNDQYHLKIVQKGYVLLLALLDLFEAIFEVVLIHARYFFMITFESIFLVNIFKINNID